RHKPKLALLAAQAAYRIKPTVRGRKILKEAAKSSGMPESWVDFQGIDYQAGGSGPAPEIPYPEFPALSDYAAWLSGVYLPYGKKLALDPVRLVKQSDA